MYVEILKEILKEGEKKKLTLLSQLTVTIEKKKLGKTPEMVLK